jgi:hypothetical protein
VIVTKHFSILVKKSQSLTHFLSISEKKPWPSPLSTVVVENSSLRTTGTIAPPNRT